MVKFSGGVIYPFLGVRGPTTQALLFTLYYYGAVFL
jgi:hypothetical protein